MKIKALFLLSAIFLSSSQLWAADSFSGVVWDVIDGDSVVVRKMNRKTQTVHLSGIDSPELKQIFGDDSKKFLHVSAMKRFVRIFVKSKNEDGSVNAVVVLDKGVNLNESMVKTGCAWVSADGKSDKTLVEYEKQAKDGKLGLWKAKAPIPPWKFRSTVSATASTTIKK